MKTATADEISLRVKEFYERNPYPGLGLKLLLKEAQTLSEFMKSPGKALFPGCGTGQVMVGLGKLRPDIELYGFDISVASLRAVQALADEHNVRVNTIERDITEPLSWGCAFDYIILQGTLHHVPDPVRALHNMNEYLAEDGYIFINLYGKKYHRRRLEIVEMLDLLQRGTGAEGLDQRFALYTSLMEQQNRWVEALANISPRKFWQIIKEFYHRLRTTVTRKYVSAPWTMEFRKLDQLWIDQYAHPYEKTYDIWEAKDLVESAELEIVDMMYLGRIDADILPMAWRPLFKQLDVWSQRRMMELYDSNAKSIYLWAKKARTIDSFNGSSHQNMQHPAQQTDQW